ncbi:hypothetical protein G7046_g186 [Stylonectria norvegica]|nr:hypothetical protein G7046_g186 [Stylonectria norvegica]
MDEPLSANPRAEARRTIGFRRRASIYIPSVGSSMSNEALACEENERETHAMEESGPCGLAFEFYLGIRFSIRTVGNVLEVPATQTVTAPQSSSTSETYEWSSGWTKTFPIHQSCNSTLRSQLAEGLDEAVQLAQHARDHLLRWGVNSEFTQKYFGNGSTSVPIGWYERIISADRTGMTFRCDDPDRNCATQDAWAGHWRGENATTETVICPLSFEIRRPLSSVCGLGYTVAESKLNTFWATDLMHRVLHVPTIAEEGVDHFAEDYAEVIALAKSDPSKSVIDSDALQYFAIDVWAYDIAAPGVGCTGEYSEESADEKPTATATESAVPSATSEAPKTGQGPASSPVATGANTRHERWQRWFHGGPNHKEKTYVLGNKQLTHSLSIVTNGACRESEQCLPASRIAEGEQCMPQYPPPELPPIVIVHV